MALFKGIAIIFSLFATIYLFFIVGIICGSTTSEKIDDKEYEVVEHGFLAATTNYYYYYEKHNMFLVKNKESYSHKI